LAQAIIKKLGGIRPAAKLLGLPVSTVANWHRKDRVPVWRLHQIEEALRTQEDFEDQNRGRVDGSSER
jgi:hypothetical protein